MDILYWIGVVSLIVWIGYKTIVVIIATYISSYFESDSIVKDELTLEEESDLKGYHLELDIAIAQSDGLLTSSQPIIDKHQKWLKENDPNKATIDQYERYQKWKNKEYQKWKTEESISSGISSCQLYGTSILIPKVNAKISDN